MGLGKTIQVLALLQHRKEPATGQGAGAGRRAPLAGLQLARGGRQVHARACRCSTTPAAAATRCASSFDEYDLIVTTYGTVRTDIAELSKIEFDYVILDEAQAIKNADEPGRQGLPAAQGPAPAGHERHADREPPGRALVDLRVPQPRHARQLDAVFKGTDQPPPPARTRAARAVLAKALKPFILRRTKAQVVEDLPEKTEQTLYCDMEPAQRRLYEELKAHYRHALLRKETTDLNRSKIEVLEALLRLRQAACHPGLIDPEPRPRSPGQARHAPAAARRGRRGGAQGPGLLAVHQLPGARPRAGSTRRG